MLSQASSLKRQQHCTNYTEQADNLRIVAKGLNAPAMNEEIAYTSTLMS